MRKSPCLRANFSTLELERPINLSHRYIRNILSAPLWQKSRVRSTMMTSYVQHTTTFLSLHVSPTRGKSEHITSQVDKASSTITAGNLERNGWMRRNWEWKQWGIIHTKTSQLGDVNATLKHHFSRADLWKAISQDMLRVCGPALAQSKDLVSQRSVKWFKP